MFGRNLKSHDQPEINELDTMFESSSIRHVGKSTEAMALDEIVKEVMNSDERW